MWENFNVWVIYFPVWLVRKCGKMRALSLFLTHTHTHSFPLAISLSVVSRVCVFMVVWPWVWVSLFLFLVFISFRLISLGFVDLLVLFDFCSFGLWFVFWVLISLCVLWVISHGYGLVMSSLFFGLISHGYGLFWFLCSLVDSHGSGLVLISHWSGFWFLSYLSLGFEFLWSLCRPFVCNNITWSVTFQHKLSFVFQRYILSMRSQVLCLFVNAK